MSTAEELLAEGVKKARKQGYQQKRGGRWSTPDGTLLDKGVDPLPIQKAAIEAGFKEARNQVDGPNEEFDIWSIATPEVCLREGDPLPDNFERVVEEWETVADSEEVKKELLRVQGRLDDS
jgi:hypothetical protein